MDYKKHYSVMKRDVLDLLHRDFNKDQEIHLLDLTFGAGGHSFSFLEDFPNCKVTSFDQDPDALANGRDRIEASEHKNRINLIDSNFCNLENEFEETPLFDGVLLDAGVSSHQFDSGERGFSFRFEGPLDMRMDPSQGTTAADLCNNLRQEELAEIIKTYGEERFSKVIAKNIVARRESSPLTSTKDLEEVCFLSYPKAQRHGKIHPATRTFQALRIEVNKELDVLSDVISQVIPRLKMNGLFMVISFHSLEDRIVKHAFKEWTNDQFPIEILTKKPMLPSSEEIFENSRSRSAKLRVVRRVERWPSKNKYSS